MISQGHTFSEIKKYTLAQLGVFVRASYRRKKQEAAQSIRMGWISAHLTQESMEEAASLYEVETYRPPKVAGPDSGIRGLANLFKGLK